MMLLLWLCENKTVYFLRVYTEVFQYEMIWLFITDLLLNKGSEARGT